VDVRVGRAEGRLRQKRDASWGVGTSAGGVPFTCAIRSAEVAGPGLGFSTCRSRFPGSVGLRLAVSCPPLLKVVCTATPFTSTCAPLMKLLPVSTAVAGPALKAIGVAAVRIGIGFITAMFWWIETAGLSTLVAVSCTMLLGVGTTAGAVLGHAAVRVGNDRPNLRIAVRNPVDRPRHAGVVVPATEIPTFRLFVTRTLVPHPSAASAPPGPDPLLPAQSPSSPLPDSGCSPSADTSRIRRGNRCRQLRVRHEGRRHRDAVPHNLRTVHKL